MAHKIIRFFQAPKQPKLNHILSEETQIYGQKQRKQKNVKHKIVLLRRDVERQVMGKKHVGISNHIRHILFLNLGVEFTTIYILLYIVCMHACNIIYILL